VAEPGSFSTLSEMSAFRKEKPCRIYTASRRKASAVVGVEVEVLGDIDAAFTGGAGMDSTKIGYWIQTAANVGILGGLVLVGLQIQQNTNAVGSEINQRLEDHYLNFEYVMMGENAAEVWSKAMQSPQDLTLAELRIMDSYTYAQYERWRHAYRLRESGYIDENKWRRMAGGDAKYILDNPFGRAWWARYKEESVGTPDFPEELVRLIDETLASDMQNTGEYFEAIQTRLTK
jgi:hypothetical protein